MSEEKLPRGHAYFRWRNNGLTFAMEFKQRDVPWLEEVLEFVKDLMPQWCIEELKDEAQRWRNAHDEIVKYAADKSEESAASLREAGVEIEMLRRENEVLTTERDKYLRTYQSANKTAERRWQKLQAIMQILGTQGDPEVEVAAVMDELEKLRAAQSPSADGGKR